MRRGALVSCVLSIALGACASPVRLLEAPRAEAPARAAVLAAEIQLWGRFGRQSLPLPRASRLAGAHARAALTARLPARPCSAPDPARNLDLEHALALYRRVATVWLADPSAARAGLSVGAGLDRIAGGCETGLILLGQQLRRPVRDSSWLALGAVRLADGRLLRLAAIPLDPDEDLARPEVLERQIGRLVRRVYR